ncbi:uncharacterized protein B0H18DRAFT_1125977 [Fomitopsis serialis]|uniref:uncharacterized protein n=1 Tax=Fomitopsis serialis TaxID=139415 RepID=UPI00200757D4|nr:uncharacterized protein B0H18DRAFT_1125977 [Neoantrodia serialis]KAH9913831.1 hypothetical protein B0H18DRAFT_1125977 [Neoantrodia serialis]
MHILLAIENAATSIPYPGRLHPTAATSQSLKNLQSHSWVSIVVLTFEPTNAPRIFAFVVAVNEYHSPSVPNLSGCINDAQDFMDYLKHVLDVPTPRISKLINGEATRSAIINEFKAHFWNNPDIHHGDALIFFFSGHGSYARAPEHWPAQNDLIELICPYDYMDEDKNDDKYGISDRTLDGLMRILADRKGDNITAILDCCHSGGMARELDPRAARADLSVPGDMGPSHIGPSCILGSPISIQGDASYILLAACRATEKAKEMRCSYDSPGAGMPENVRGVFSANLIQTLRTMGRERLEALTYARLMDDLPRRAIHSLPSLLEQHPQCDGTHSDRVLFSTRRLPDAPDSFILIRHGDTWHVRAGTIHGITKGTQFALPPPLSGIQAKGGVIFEAENVWPTTCEVPCRSAGVEFDSSIPQRVVVTHWNQPISLATRVYVRRTPGDDGLAINTRALYRVTHDEDAFDLTLDAIPGGWRIERFDPLVTRFFGSRRVLEVAGRSSAHATGVLDAISRFNFHLYRSNVDVAVDKELRLTVQMHALEEMVETVCEAWEQSHSRLGRGEEVVLRTVQGMTSLYCHKTDASRCSGNIDGQKWADPRHFHIPKPVEEAMITNFDRQYGFTLVNNSSIDLFPYVYFFDPSTYAVKVCVLSAELFGVILFIDIPAQELFSPRWGTCEAPLPVKGHICIGYGGFGTNPLRFTRPETHSDNAVGFLKIFVSTCYVELNIEQPPLFDPPEKAVHLGHIPMCDPPARAAHLGHIPMQDNWNSWTYVLTSQATKDL